LGRPKTFSPMRRSSLYLALVRFDISHSPICYFVRPGTAPAAIATAAITASPGMRDQLGIRLETGFDGSPEQART